MEFPATIKQVSKELGKTTKWILRLRDRGVFEAQQEVSYNSPPYYLVDRENYGKLVHYFAEVARQAHRRRAIKAPEGYHTVRDLIDILNISESYVYRLVQWGKITYRVLDGVYIFSDQDVQMARDYLASVKGNSLRGTSRANRKGSVKATEGFKCPECGRPNSHNGLCPKCYRKLKLGGELR